MARRVIQNSFVSGEVAPELWGRQDLKALYQGAASIRNFTVRRTGGVRKRFGTRLLARFHREGSTAYRCVPFLFDRTTYCILVLMKAAGSTALRYRLLKSAAGTVTLGNEETWSGTSIQNAAALNELHVKQYGDTLVFTNRARRAFKAQIYADALRVEFSELVDNISVAQAPAMSATPSGFGSGGDYVATSRRYALFGVKSGIYGPPREVTVNITLPWKANARIGFSFVPDWSKADYYVLGGFLGVHYGNLATFYPSSEGGTRTDATWANGVAVATATIDETEYTAGTADIATKWKNDPNALSGSIHASGTFVPSGSAISCTYKSGNSTVLGVRIWFGAIVSAGGSDEPLGNEGSVTVELLGSGGSTLAEWTVSALYSQEAQTLLVQSPVKQSATGYSLKLTSSTGAPVLLRGAVLATDSGTRTFTDDNISPGSVFGVQQRLQVGDSGMDVDHSAVWEQRMVLAASQSLPFSLWFSQVGDLYNFYADRPQVADNAFSISIPPTGASRILHIHASRWLTVFTESGEYVVDTVNGTLAYNTVTVRPCSSVGAHGDIAPVESEKNLLFVAADGRGVYELRYDLSEDKVIPVNRSTYASHLTYSRRIKAIAYARYPEGVLWCLCTDGTVLSLTYMPEQEVCAWAHHDFAGGGLVLEDILCPGSLDDSDGVETSSDVLLAFTHPDAPGDLWLERMVPAQTGSAPFPCVDHGGYAAADNPPDGDPATPVAARIETLRPDIPEGGNTMATTKMQFEAAVRVLASGKVGVAPLGSGLPAATTREDVSTALFTGDARVLPFGAHGPEGRLAITSEDENPCEILALLQNVEIGQTGGR